MRLLTTILCFATLAACAGNPADTAARKASERPLTASIQFTTPGADIYQNKPASLTQDNTNDSDFAKNLFSALVQTNYAQTLYQADCYQDDGHKQCSNQYTRVYGLTDKGKSAGWHCAPASNGQGTICDVPLGTVQPGAAEITDFMGTKYVKFYVTPTPNDIGKAMGGNLNGTNWGNDCNSLKFGAKAECSIALGPDGAPIR